MNMNLDMFLCDSQVEEQEQFEQYMMYCEMMEDEAREQEALAALAEAEAAQGGNW